MKKRHFKHEPLDAVGDANPVDVNRLPSAADDPRAQALLQAITSLPVEGETPSRQSSPRRAWTFQPAWAASAALALVAGVVGTVALLGNGSPSDSQTVPTAPISSSSTIPSDSVPVVGFCVELYDLVTLANRDVAFDGTVTSIDGDEVTFAVNQWFLGDQGTEVTLTATGLTGGATNSGGGITLDGEVTSVDGGLTLIEGERFLVTGSGGFVWSCGFTQAYDPAVAADWAGVFSG